MLIVALVLAVIGLAALVTAVVTSNEVVAWVCIAASALGVILLIVDAVRERKIRRLEVFSATDEESGPLFIADADDTEFIEPAADTEVLTDIEVLTGTEDQIIAEDHPEELVHDEPEYDMPGDDEPEYTEPAEEAAIHIVDEETVAAESDDNIDAPGERGDR